MMTTAVDYNRDWMTETPAEDGQTELLTYDLEMFAGGSLQNVQLTREEFIWLKEQLGARRAAEARAEDDESLTMRQIRRVADYIENSLRNKVRVGEKDPNYRPSLLLELKLLSDLFDDWDGGEPSCKDGDVDLLTSMRRQCS